MENEQDDARGVKVDMERLAAEREAAVLALIRLPRGAWASAELALNALEAERAALVARADRVDRALERLADVLRERSSTVDWALDWADEEGGDVGTRLESAQANVARLALELFPAVKP